MLYGRIGEAIRYPHLSQRIVLKFNKPYFFLLNLNNQIAPPLFKPYSSFQPYFLTKKIGRNESLELISYYLCFRLSTMLTSYNNIMTVDYNNLYIHFVFNTSGRIKLIQEKHRNRIEKYITGIVKNHESRLYAIYANSEHMHMLISKSSELSEDELATIIADSSASFINKNNLCAGVFSWQQSCAAFSVSKDDVERVCKYIFNQPEHHKKYSFKDEYQEFIMLYELALRPLKE